MDDDCLLIDPGWEKRQGRRTVVTRIQMRAGCASMHEEELTGNMAETCEKIKRILAADPDKRRVMVNPAGIGAAILGRLRADGLPVVPLGAGASEAA